MGRGLYSIPVAFRILIVSSLFLCGLRECARIRASEPVPIGVGEGTAVDLDGAVVDPLKASAGKIVVLIFVGVDCPISNRYAPTIQGIERRVRLEDAGRVAFWLVYPDRSESAEQIRKHKKEFGYELPALRDLQRNLVAESNAQTTPEAAVFDANHKLIYHGRIDNLYEDFWRARPPGQAHELA